MKKCTKCKELKLVSEFYVATRYAGGIKAQCKKCEILAGALRSRKNRAQRSAYAKEWRAAHPKNVAVASLRMRRQYVAEIHPLYAKQLLSVAMNVSSSCIPIELIAAKQAQLKLFRILEKLAK